MPEGVDFPFPSLLFYEGRTYGQPVCAYACRARSVGGAFSRKSKPDTAERG